MVKNLAFASYFPSKKENRAEASGNNNSKDIHLENFDISYGEKVLIRSATISLGQCQIFINRILNHSDFYMYILLAAFGRRYGFVGRNGLGKTTVLRQVQYLPGY